MTITEFLNNELVDFASYTTLRAIGSLVDGQKNAQRKVIHTVQRKNIIKDQKVEILAGTVAIETEYLHGPSNLNSVIIGLAQNFVGNNNIPLLMREGNFGNRFEPEASAPRYILTLKEPIFDKIFIKEDNNILLSQSFEGTVIEPRFFVPTIPLILVNGSEGIATGFAQKILPRNVDVIKDYIKSYLVPGTSLPELPPFYNGFDGTITAGENPNQWNIGGKFERKSATRIVITELPIGYNLKSYTKELDAFEEKKIIRSYEDLSESKTDKFKFELVMDTKSLKNDDEWIMKKLKLTKSVTENFTVIDENNRVLSYTSPEEVINHYIEVKIQYLDKRKEYQVQQMKKDILLLASKYLFVKSVTDGTVIVNKKKKTEIVTQLKPIEKIITDEGSYDYLLRMPIYNLTIEKLQELKAKIMQTKQELNALELKEISETWAEELDII